MNAENEADRRWYAGITWYQWLVLVIACLGWIFDVFEGQIFAVFKTLAMADVLLVAKDHADVQMYSNIAFASFLIGGTVGGLFFGVMADRIGRRQTMVWSILTYSVFTGMHYFATTWWHIVGLRFFVAMGVAGEWAIAAALVSEVFPKRARAMAGGIFHASSVLGAVMAAGAGMFLTNRRWAFLICVLPALLIVWIRVSLKESEKWQAATERSADEGGKEKKGSLRELLTVPQWRNRALIGMGLAAVGLATYWGIYAWAPELVRQVLGDSVSDEKRQSIGSFVYLIMNCTGGLAGLLAFAPISMYTNRRTAFAFYHIGALIIVPITYLCTATYMQALVLLSIMAFFTVGMHAGYAIYFPELFPTRLRATGASFCFNVGRLVSALALFVSGWLATQVGLRYAATAMASLFLVGLILLLIAPETKDTDLSD